ncbi:MAG: NUDIX hydrolase [Dermatophilaceae bacterium]
MTIRAAGTVPWRVRDDVLQVALVHRPRHHDWAWPKGKLEPGEDWPTAAARETAEETGRTVRLGPPLPQARYSVLGRDGSPNEKIVRYWCAEVVGRTSESGPVAGSRDVLASGASESSPEVDEVAWLDVTAAHDRLDYAHDRDQLLALAQRHHAGRLATWPLVLVRHAHAVARGAWSRNDDLRPLDRAGYRRAQALAPLLAAYRISRLVSSPAERCTATLGPYATSSGCRVRTRDGLSENGFGAAPEAPERQLLRLLDRGEPAALCTHGPVLPALLDALSLRLDGVAPTDAATTDAARQARLVKGEAFVCHVAGRGSDAQVVAVERHLPCR